MTKRALKKKLSNPFALMAQGFAVGALLFWVTMPDDLQAQVPVPLAQSAIILPQ
ncbi:hypothetical protein [Allosphingosinicella vermicomposti]|uniref:hypothetical protein n=1 Tax=Allosphingosinicella vermicomposti TaxID=614671 RepID=UPI00131A4E69|nr:hypothetical protein [Allosphingosinicella vermicomposti]